MATSERMGDGGFKAGDRVAYTGLGSVVNEHRIGKTGEITKVDQDGFGVSVKWDDGAKLPMVVQQENLRMTTERNAQGVDGLAEVMGLIREATPGPWETASRCEYATQWEVCDCGGAFEPDGKTKVIAAVQDYCMSAEGDAAAIAATVNYLRSHGEAIRELVEADREYDAAMRNEADTDGMLRREAARNRRAAALAKFPEPRT